jgi:protein arginine N-methyltransferase 1
VTGYDIVTHAAMLADTGRVQAYARALAERVRPGATVVDLGTGTGLFALLACRAGAARVYAVEPDDVIEVAREMAWANGVADRVTFVQARSTAIDLPERVDGIVADVRGALPLYRDAIRVLIDARDRFLKPGGWIVPARDTLVAAIASSPLAADLMMFGAGTFALGLDTSAVARRAREMWFRYRASAGDLLTEPRAWATLDYQSLVGTDATGTAEWIATQPGTAHGLSLWFDAETAPGITLTNSPGSLEPHVYGHVFLPWLEPVDLRAGDRVAVEFRASLAGADYIWGWKTSIEPASGGQRLRWTQSSFAGATVSEERLRRRAHTFVPTLGEDAETDRLALSLLGRGWSLGEVAGVLAADHPQRFADFNDALTHVADLSERYAR